MTKDDKINERLAALELACKTIEGKVTTVAEQLSRLCAQFEAISRLCFEALQAEAKKRGLS